MVASQTRGAKLNGTSALVDHATPMCRGDVSATFNHAPPAVRRNEPALLAWMRYTAPLLFLAAVATSFFFYDGLVVQSTRLAPLIGFGVAVVLGLLAYYLWAWKSTPPCSNPRQFGKLAHWCTVLDSHLSVWCAEPQDLPDGVEARTVERACRGAILHRNFVAASLGLIPEQLDQQDDAQTLENPPQSGGKQGGKKKSKRVVGQRWLTGAGYVELWERLHRAEEDMFLVLPTQEIVAAGQYDELRLAGSTISNRQGLLYRLSVALSRLGGSAYLATEPQAGPEGAAILRKKLNGAHPCPELDECKAARYALREIRFAINEYRDAQRDGMVRVRTNLCWTGTLTALVAFGLFGLAIAFNAPIESIYGATAIYLVGAVVGLFNSLSISAEDDGTETEEDYGLAQARLLNSPMLSGLAAVGGVLLAYIGVGALGDASTGTGDASDFPQIWQIFNIETNPETVAIAALFGLTPRLLIKRLQTEGDRFRQGLKSSSAPTGKQANEAG